MKPKCRPSFVHILILDAARPVAAEGILVFGGAMEEQKRFSTHFFPCNAIGLMLNFAKDGGRATCPRCTPASANSERDQPMKTLFNLN